MNNENFEKNTGSIYTAQLKLIKENKVTKNYEFLDWNINIHNSTFQTNLYDKRDNFNFNKIKMSSKSSNVPN